MEQSHTRYSSTVQQGPSVYLVWGIFLVWITFFLGQFVTLFHMRSPLQAFVSFVSTLLFFTIYIRTSWVDARYWASDSPTVTRTVRQSWLPIIALTVIGAFMTLLNGYLWGGMFIYTSAVAASHLPRKQGIAMILGLSLLPIIGATLEGGWQLFISAAFTIPVTGFCCIAMMWALKTNRELRLARRELAEMAVTEERLRFARDLHDLLGHTLSLIALKSELAGRLVQRAPERAEAEISDIEAAARQALHEVREAVAGYRQPTLAGELHAAQEMLAAAGITYVLNEEIAATPLRATVEAMLAWTVREGVTNVIRHSHAQRCEIHVGYQADNVQVTVSDDGQTDADGAASATGNGLRGLCERADELGGTCQTERLAAGGSRLTVALPLIAAPKLVMPVARVKEGVLR